MDSREIGRLERVDLREVWLREDTDFTPWLGSQENLELLGDTLGIELELEAQEKNVGPFRADLLCRDTADEDHLILVENQLARTDHGHLGQLLTYAAGLKAVTIVWIAERFTDEHRAALDWLNEITSEEVQFFGLEVQLWRIGISPVAPKFQVVSRPNEWVRSVSGASRRFESSEPTETARLAQAFWRQFFEKLESRRGPLRTIEAPTRRYVHFPIGRSGFHLGAAMNTQDHRLGVRLTLKGRLNKVHFKMLLENKEEIEAAAGEPLFWDEKPGKKQAGIAIRWKGADPQDESKWPEYQDWMISKLELLHRVFAQRVRALDASEWEASSEAEDD